MKDTAVPVLLDLVLLDELVEFHQLLLQVLTFFLQAALRDSNVFMRW